MNPFDPVIHRKYSKEAPIFLDVTEARSFRTLAGGETRGIEGAERGHRPAANSAGRVWRASASSTALIMPLSSGPKKAAATSTYSVTATRAGTSGRLRNS